MDFYIGEKQTKEKKIKFSERTKTTLNKRTRIPKSVTEIDMFPLMLKKGTVPLTEKNVEKVFKSFLTDEQDFFKIVPTDLKLISKSKVGSKWLAKFQQVYQGIPVHKSTVGLTATEDGKMDSISSNFHPRIDVPTKPKINLTNAAQIAKETFKEPDVIRNLKMEDDIKIIFPSVTSKGVTYHLAWKFLLTAGRAYPESEMYFIIDAIDGTILLSYAARFPGARISGHVRGEIYDVDEVATPETVRALQNEQVRVQWSGRAQTDDDGRYSLQLSFLSRLIKFFTGSYRVRFVLEGSYARVEEFNGPRFIERERFSNRTNCDHTWRDADRDHINVFYHMNLFRDWLKSQVGYSWINGWDGSRQFKAEVNRPGFNNAMSGNPMNFGTDPWARSSDIIYHECMHNVLFAIYGDWIGWPVDDEEGYSMDEGFADYFACSFTGDSSFGEGAMAVARNLDNNQNYPSKNTYNIEGHTGGQIIAGAAWDLREILIARFGAANGARLADNMLFDAHQMLANQAQDYYFSDPQESNLLTCLYNTDDGRSHIQEIRAAFWNHNLLQAVLFDRDSYDFSANVVSEFTGGDLYYYQGKFWANNPQQRGVIDLGDVGATTLDAVNIPNTGYTRFGVDAVAGHTYVSMAQEGEDASYIAFRVTEMSGDSSEVTVEYFYHAKVG
ncbi:MAG: hypothetical protein E3J86_06075 [Candidatus Thorarchaeota archaeon]|nr:MAG: hypothetical protein E3J86_06075 [Candidatus Thorarchaeota archaeon]